MTKRAEIFSRIIESVCWTKGWGTTGTQRRFPDLCEEEKLALDWLVSNGYLFHFQREEINKRRNWRYSKTIADRYGVTKKGWEVAPKFVKVAMEELPGFALQYRYDWYPRMPE